MRSRKKILAVLTSLVISSVTAIVLMVSGPSATTSLAWGPYFPHPGDYSHWRYYNGTTSGYRQYHYYCYSASLKKYVYRWAYKGWTGGC